MGALRTATFVLLFGTGAIFPVALGLSRLLRERILYNTNPLAKLMALSVLMVNLLWAPIRRGAGGGRPVLQASAAGWTGRDHPNRALLAVHGDHMSAVRRLLKKSAWTELASSKSPLGW